MAGLDLLFLSISSGIRDPVPEGPGTSEMVVFEVQNGRFWTYFSYPFLRESGDPPEWPIRGGPGPAEWRFSRSKVTVLDLLFLSISSGNPGTPRNGQSGVVLDPGKGGFGGPK